MTTTVNLRMDAEAEAQRLAAARARASGLERVAQPFDASGPLIARARGARRRALDGQLLLVWQVGCEDASGRTAAAAIVAMLVRLDAAPHDRAARCWIKEFVARIDAHVPVAIEGVLRPRQCGLVDACHARADTRLARERAIAAHLSTAAGRPAEYQVGLFDGRTERAHRVRASDARELEDRVRARVLAATSASAVSSSRPRLLLALRP
jgi:hypothetical protein